MKRVESAVCIHHLRLRKESQSTGREYFAFFRNKWVTKLPLFSLLLLWKSIKPYSRCSSWYLFTLTNFLFDQHTLPLEKWRKKRAFKNIKWAMTVIFIALLYKYAYVLFKGQINYRRSLRTSNIFFLRGGGVERRLRMVLKYATQWRI